MQAQLAIEKNPDFVVITADIKNFYNEGDRDKALEEHAKGIRQGNIDMGKDFKLHYNLSAQESPIFGNNGQRLEFTSSMGGQQGCPMSSRNAVPALASVDGGDRRAGQGRWRRR